MGGNSKEEWKNTVEKLAQQEEWIIDGNYGGTMKLRTDRADTIFYLDYPTLKCLLRITKRIIKYRGRKRPDMPEGCHERFDLGFYHYVATYNMIRREKLLTMLETLSGNKNIYIIRNDKEAEHILKKN